MPPPLWLDAAGLPSIALGLVLGVLLALASVGVGVALFHLLTWGGSGRG